MPPGKGMIIDKQLTSPFMKCGTSSKSRDKFFKEGRAITLIVLALHVKHLHYISISIITLIHKHHAMVLYHFMLCLCGRIV